MLKEQLKLIKEKLDESMYRTFANGDADAPVDETLMRRIKILNWIFIVLSCIIAISCVYWLFIHYSNEWGNGENSNFGSLKRNGAASSRNEEYSNFGSLERNGAVSSRNEENTDFGSLKRNGAGSSRNEENSNFESLKRNGAGSLRNEEYSNFESLKRNGAGSSRNEQNTDFGSL